MTDGNRERLDREYLAWILRYRRERRPGILQRLSEVADEKDVAILRSRTEVQGFIAAAANQSFKRTPQSGAA